MSRRMLVGWVAAGLLACGIGWVAACGTPTYYSVRDEGYYGTAGWYDPWYYRPCCRGYDRPHHDRPHRPPDMRPPGHRPPGMRPPGGGRPPGIPSRPRPHPHRR